MGVGVGVGINVGTGGRRGGGSRRWRRNECRNWRIGTWAWPITVGERELAMAVGTMVGVGGSWRPIQICAVFRSSCIAGK